MTTRTASRPGIPAARATTEGLVVAFVGCDGSGKSTVVAALTERLSAEHPTRRLYLGSGRGPSSLLRLPLLLAHRLFTRRAARRDRADGAGAGAPQSGPRRLLRPVWALLLAHERHGKLRKAWGARRRGVVVLCDRYPQNEIEGFNDGPLLGPWRAHRSRLLRTLSRWERRSYEEAQRRPPDLIVKLVVSPVVARSRKPDMTSAEIARRVAAIDSLRFGAAARTVRICADDPLDQVIRQVEQAIRQRLAVGAGGESPC